MMVLLLVLFVCGIVHAAEEVCVVNNELPFNFAIGQCLFDARHMAYFTVENVDEYANLSLSFLSATETKGLVSWKSEGVLPPELTYNNKPHERNPIHGVPIAQMTLLDNVPVIVTRNEPGRLWYLRTPNPPQLLGSVPLCDAQGNQAEIVALTAAHVLYEQKDLHGKLEKKMVPYICAALKSRGDQLQELSLALTKVTEHTYQEEKNEHEQQAKKPPQRDYFLKPLDVYTGQEDGNRAYALKMDDPCIAINGGIASLNAQAITMHWDDYHNCAFIGFDLCTRDDARSDQGGCALAVAHIVPACPTCKQDEGLGKQTHAEIVLQPFLLPEAVHGNNAIIAAKGPSQHIHVQTIRTMLTSTKARYLIVQCHHNECTGIYALPLVYNKHEKTEGWLAAASKDPLAVYRTHRFSFENRSFMYSAQRPEQVPSVHDQAVLVGGGLSLGDACTQMFIVGDSVYAVVPEQGIFYSQALLGAQGAITAWTPWARAVYTDGRPFAADLNPSDGSFVILQKSQHESKVDTPAQVSLRRTAWRMSTIVQQDAETTSDAPLPSDDLAFLLSQQFQQERGGIQQCMDIPSGAPGCTQTCSSVVAVGGKRVCIAQTSGMHDGHLKPFIKGFGAAIVTCAHDQVPQLSSLEQQTPRVITLTGDVLNSCAPLTSAAWVADKHQAWLVVGGVGGCAVLCRPDGSGILRQDGFGDSMEKLSGMRFNKIADCSFVQKCMSDEENLYVMTRKNIERIPLVQDEFARSCSTRYTVASARSCFYDAEFLGSSFVVADSCGLWQTLSHTQVHNARRPEDLAWDLLPMADERDHIRRLYWISAVTSGHGTGSLGMLYALTHSQHGRSCVYRYAVNADGVQQINDHHKKKYTEQCFCQLGANKELFVTDGSVYLHATRGGIGAQPTVGSITRAVNIARPAETHPLPLDHSNCSIRAMRNIFRNSATGDWVLVGDYGVGLMH